MTVSLPSIHEMFPAHLMYRDELDGGQAWGNYPSPTTVNASFSTCTVVGCHCSSACSSSMFSSTSAHTHTPATISGDSWHSPGSDAQPRHDNGQASVPGAASESLLPYTRLSAHQPTHTQPHAPPRPPPGHLLNRQHKCSRDGRESHHAHSPHPRDQHNQQPVDISDDEEDASEGSLGDSPVPSNTRIPMHHSVPPHVVQVHQPLYFMKGMSMIPMTADGSAGVDGIPSGKKHACPTCFKRFNRPSSLRIHANTHTGATPFRCPWPNCGREFSVNSNMRRHYRNHAIASSSSTNAPPASNSTQVGSQHIHIIPITTYPAVPTVLRGEIRAGAPPSRPHAPTPSSGSLPWCGGSTHGQPHSHSHSHSQRLSEDLDRSRRRSEWHAHSPNQFQREERVAYYRLEKEFERQDSGRRGSPNTEEEVGGLEDPQSGDGGMEVDRKPHAPSPPRALSRSARPRSLRSCPQPLHPYAYPLPPPRAFVHSPDSSGSPAYSNTSPPRLLTPRSFISILSKSSHSSMSPSVSPVEEEPLYNPSTPYSRCLADTRVSTTLRPAFG
ncbi:unnamed protein product [Cyclocybe aegerita]|uniref:C2H2-type domain-containing protein n=1 Tax=Cyclocybe aegerita TaxID=1973307 RepID=A0A8S0W3H3_CYCAE|nr:unnamed protein product [Cyclocybe aegerita]